MEIDMQKGFGGDSENSIIRYDYEFNRQSYKEQEGISALNLPSTLKELLQLLKKQNINPLDNNLKIFELYGHIEQKDDYDGYQTYQYNDFCEDDKSEFTKENIKCIINIYWDKI